MIGLFGASLILATSSFVLSPASGDFIANTATQAVVEQAAADNSSIEPLISAIATKYRVSSTTLYNVAKSESGLQDDPPGHNDGGAACGVVQVHADMWGYDCQYLKDHPETGLEFLAKHLKSGDAWKYWTSLNCYTYVSHFVNLPRMADIVPNTSLKKGVVAVFIYSGSVEHLAYVTAVHGSSFEVTEANFKPGLISTRTVSIYDPHLRGFWG